MHAVIRVEIESASNVLEHIVLDQSAEPTNLPLALLKHITEDFNDRRQIGCGGFGIVYKVSLDSKISNRKRFFTSSVELGLKALDCANKTS